MEWNNLFEEELYTCDGTIRSLQNLNSVSPPAPPPLPTPFFFSSLHCWCRIWWWLMRDINVFWWVSERWRSLEIQEILQIMIPGYRPWLWFDEFLPSLSLFLHLCRLLPPLFFYSTVRYAFICSFCWGLFWLSIHFEKKKIRGSSFLILCNDDGDEDERVYIPFQKQICWLWQGFALFFFFVRLLLLFVVFVVWQQELWKKKIYVIGIEKRRIIIYQHVVGHQDVWFWNWKLLFVVHLNPQSITF